MRFIKADGTCGGSSDPTPENTTMTGPLRDLQAVPAFHYALWAACRVLWVGGRICPLEIPDWH